jgi:hypothetical protein
MAGSNLPQANLWEAIVQTGNPRLDSRSGQIAIMLALCLVPLFGVVGLVTDIGYMRFIKMSAQTAAEAAAMATIDDMHATLGGAITSCGGGVVCASTATACTANITTPTNSVQRGCMYAQKHGFNGSNQVTYQSGIGGTPPTATGAASASYWVTFRVIQTVPQMFSAVVGNTSGIVAARSSAAILGASDCVYAMNPNQSGALQIGGSASLTSSCGLFVNSNNTSALGTNGGGTLTAPEYDVVGGVSTHYTLTPSPNTGVSPTTDPLSYLPVPASPPYTCDYTNYSASNWSNPTLSAGVYCGGINVGNNTFTLNPGTYILVGGGLSTQSSNSTITGTGVTFYNTYDSTYAYAPISIAANSNVTLKAPNSGTYAGILFFEDRSAPASSDTYGGGSSAVYQGVIYAKNAAITMYGNSSINTKYTLIVADTISLVGSTALNSDYSLLPNGSPITRIAMVE